MAAVTMWAVLRPFAAMALGPHELALIVNRADPESLHIANVYADTRSVPSSNIVALELPDKMLGESGACTLDDFNTYIRDPVRAALRERGIDHHVLAWVFSAGFPFRVNGRPPLSLTGAVFTGGEHPGEEQVKRGRYPSPVFQGPVRPKGERGRPQSLDHFGLKLRASGNVPAMLLAHTGARGLSPAEAIEMIARGARSDYTRPPGSVIFVQTGNVRSKARAWQFEEAVNELDHYGVPARIQQKSAVHNEPLAGVCEGNADVPVHRLGVFVPGAIAEHLTSFGAAFDKPAQMKITAWFRAGASGSAGTVTEPLAIWTKFPHARTYAHYAAGCTMLESFYLGLASPLQILPVGDPLARPWAEPVRVDLLCLEDGALSGPAAFALKAWNPVSQRARTALFLDGRPIRKFSSDTLINLNTTAWPDGYHRLRAVSQVPGPVAHQGFSEIGLIVDNRGYRVTLSREGQDEDVDLAHWVFFRADVTGPAERVELMQGERVLAAAAPGELLAFDPGETGQGPVTLQARAFIEGRPRPVYSAPVDLLVEDLNQAPRMEALEASREHGVITLTGRAVDPEHDPVSMEWFELAADRILIEAPPEKGTAGEDLPFRAAAPEWTLAADVRMQSGYLAYKTWVHGGIAVRSAGEKNPLVFGFNGNKSCWMLRAGPADAGQTLFSRTARIEEDRVYRLEARADGEGAVSFYVDGRLMTDADLPAGARPELGVCAFRGAVSFRNLAVSPPITSGAQARESILTLPAEASGTYLLRAGDGFKYAWSEPYSP